MPGITEQSTPIIKAIQAIRDGAGDNLCRSDILRLDPLYAELDRIQTIYIEECQSEGHLKPAHLNLVAAHADYMETWEALRAIIIEQENTELTRVLKPLNN